MKKKTKKNWNLKQKLKSAIRKIWRMSPLRARALFLACVNKDAPVRERLYKCAGCGGLFLSQQIDVDHKESANKNESIGAFINRIFCGVEAIEFNDEEYPIANTEDEKIQLDMLINTHLSCLCLKCHKNKTKAENEKRRK